MRRTCRGRPWEGASIAKMRIADARHGASGCGNVRVTGAAPQRCRRAGMVRRVGAERSRNETGKDACSCFTPPPHEFPGCAQRRLAAAVFLFLAVLWQTPAGAVTLGSGADDTVTVPTFTNVANYNSNNGKNAGGWVQIGTHTLPNWMIGNFFGENAVTADKLIKTYANAAAYLADTTRSTRLFAVIGSNIYSVTALEALNNSATLTDSNLPDAITPPSSTTALGDNAAATAHNTVAVGAGANAAKTAGTAVGDFATAGEAATALGYNAHANGLHSVAIGEGSRVYDGRSVAVGHFSRTSGGESTVVGTNTVGFGEDAAVLGNTASVIGDGNTALGRRASAADWGAGNSEWDTVPEGLGYLTSCAMEPGYITDGQWFVDDCSALLTTAEKAHANLFPDTSAGRTYRGTVQTRLRARLNGYAVNRATAVGSFSYARATAATAMGANAVASAQGATSLGYLARAHGEWSSALGGDAFGDYAHALGAFSDALGADSIAAGRGAVAGRATAPVGVYANLQNWLDATVKPTTGSVAIAGELYSAAALGAVSGLTEATLPSPLVAAPGTVAIGADAVAGGNLPEYANVAAFLADADRSGGWTRIGEHVYPAWEIANFFGDRGVAAGDVTAEYANVAAYLADGGRAARPFAVIDGALYRTSSLEAANAAGTLPGALPAPVWQTIDGWRAVAVGTGASASTFGAAFGTGAQARGPGAAAVGSGADASGDWSTAVGGWARAPGANASAFGGSALASGDGSSALGGLSNAVGERATAVGLAATARGDRDATALGEAAVALGRENTALGRHAVAAAAPGAGRSVYSAVPARGQLWEMVQCAEDAAKYADGPGAAADFQVECIEYLTAAERANADMFADSAAGRTQRRAVQARLKTALGALELQWATAVGAYARASAAESTAVGHASVASGFESTALGQSAFATAPRATAVGEHAEAHGADTTALGREARAGGVATDWLYLDVESYLADPDRTDHANVIIGGEPYSVRALEAVTDLGPDTLPARLAATTGGTAVGAGAQASGTDAIALGRAAAATGSNAIAVGAGASAGADQVVIGRDGHSYRLPGLAPDGGVARLLAVDARGQLVAGAVQAGTGAPDFGVRLAALEAEAVSSGERVTTLESGFSAVDDRLGKEDDGTDRDGNAYQRITALDNDLGAATQLAHSDGSAYQRIASVREIVETAAEDPAALTAANALTTVRESTRALTAEDTKLREAIENADSGDRVEKVRIRTGTGEERTVVTLRGATNEQIMTLVALLTDRRLSTTVAAGADGEPVGTTMTEFLELDELHGHNVVSTKERLAYLFQALYGPDYAGRADGSTDSDAPHRQSIEGRVRIIELDDEGKQLREADDGLGAGAHRVVVQETSPQDGRGRLRTMPFDNFDGAAALRKVDALTGRVDNLRRDLDKLDTHVDRVAAMTSALTALPNAVAGGDRYSLGMGVGHHRGTQALALGMSVRLVGERNVFANAGVALGEGSTVTARAGVSVSW